jgi:large subunit ribosomal protein L34
LSEDKKSRSQFIEDCSPEGHCKESLMSKQTYQPKKRRRQRVHGFMKRMSTRVGQAVLKRRRLKGRKRVAI